MVIACERSSTEGHAYVALGANVGDRLGTLRHAINHIGRLGTVHSVSSVYETDPVGYADQPPYLNMVLSLETSLEPVRLMQSLLAIEQVLGRVRTFPNAPRTLDLDLLLYEDHVIAEPTLILPHPRMHERAFVLVPLAEIAASVRDPVSDRTIDQLLNNLGEPKGVRIFAPPLNLSPSPEVASGRTITPWTI